MSKKVLLNFIFTIALYQQIFSQSLWAMEENSDNSFHSFSGGFSLNGELKYGKNFRHFDYVNPQMKKGGTIKYGAAGTFNNLNPFILKGISAAGIDLIYDSLMVKSEDEPLSYYGLIAEAVSYDDKKNYVIFKLRKNARFSDGKSITADDVIFTFHKLISDGHPSYRAAYSDVKQVSKINLYEVRFDFKEKHKRDLIAMVAELTVLPKHYYDKVEFNKTTLEAPVGSGPYKIAKVEAGKSITYKRDESYWGKDLAVNRGRYNFDEIIYDYYRDENVLIEAFKAGKYDFRQENVARNWANAYNIDAIKNGQIIKKEIVHGLPAPVQLFVLNLRKEKFQNIALRQAMTYAFDFEWLKQHIFYNAYTRTESYFPNSQYAQHNFKLPYSEGDGFNRKNLIVAAQILKDAGYELKDGKLLDPKNHQAITLEFLIDSKNFEMIVAPFVQNLKKLGIQAKTRFVDDNQYETRVNNFDFDVIVAVLRQNLLPGSELFFYFHSSQKNIRGGANLMGLDNKEVDMLVEKIAATNNQKELLQLCRKLDEILLTNYYGILQWHNNSYRILYRDIFTQPKITPKYSLGMSGWGDNSPSLREGVAAR